MKTIKEILVNDLKFAIKMKLPSMRNIVRQINTRINSYEKDNNVDATDSTIINFMVTELKELNATAEHATGDLASEIAAQKLYLLKFDEYKPKALNASSVKEIVANLVKEHSLEVSMNSMGFIMNQIKKSYKNQDNKFISGVVKEILTA